MGALIAYFGDHIGSKIGRRRLSFLGMRPRKTAALMTIVTGMVITMTTLLVSSIFVENVRLALFEDIYEIKQKSLDLEAGYKVLQGRKEELETKVNLLSMETGELGRERERLLELQQKTADDITRFREENAHLNELLATEQIETLNLEKEIESRNMDLVKLKKSLTEIEKENVRLKAHESQIQKENESFKLVIGTLSSEKEKLIERLNQSLQEKIALKELKEELEANLSRTRQERENSEALLKSLQTDLVSMRQIKQDLEKQVEENIEEITSREEVLGVLKADLEETRLQIENKKIELDNLSGQISRLQVEYQEANETIESLEKVIQDKKQKRLVLRYMEPLIEKPVLFDKPVSKEEFTKIMEQVMTEMEKRMSGIGIILAPELKNRFLRLHDSIFARLNEIWEEIERSHPFNEWPSRGAVLYPVSENNLVESESLSEAQFIVMENRMLIVRGREIARASIDARLSAEELLAGLFEIDDQIKKQMFSQGVLGNRFKPRSPQQIMQFARIVDELKGLGQQPELETEPVFLSIVAGDDIYSSGDFSLLYNIITKAEAEQEESKKAEESPNRPDQIRERLEKILKKH
jgi:predicted  nucleic acid-binding Zn-ribbon protein